MSSLSARRGGVIQAGNPWAAHVAPSRDGRGTEKALANSRRRGIEALVVIGGNGSQTGAYVLSQMGYPVVGVASTIDNDLYGSEITIGVDTALDIALEAIDRLQGDGCVAPPGLPGRGDGARLRVPCAGIGHCGWRRSTVIPEVPTNPEAVAIELIDAYNRGKSNGLVVVAEGAAHNAAKLAQYFGEHHERLGFDLRDDAWPCARWRPRGFRPVPGKPIGWRGDRALARGEYGHWSVRSNPKSGQRRLRRWCRRRRCSTRGCSSWLLC